MIIKPIRPLAEVLSIQFNVQRLSIGGYFKESGVLENDVPGVRFFPKYKDLGIRSDIFVYEWTCTEVSAYYFHFSRLNDLQT